MPKTVPPNLRAFFLELGDEEVELRFPWTAFARGSEWIGLPWYRWDFFDHRHLAAIIAAGRLFEDKGATPEKLAELLPPHRFAEIRQIVDDAVAFAQSGKTREERIAEAKARAAKQKAESEESEEGEASGEAEAGPAPSRPARKTGPTLSKKPAKQG